MRKLIGSIAIFSATYLLLSINIGNRPIFDSLYDLTSPLTQAAQKFVSKIVGAGVDGTKTVGQKIFLNSIPVAKKTSTVKAKNLSAPQENIQEAERRELNDLIKNYSR